jgi:hypothetical protein
MLLDRNSLLTKDEVQVEKVDFPNGDHIYVKMMYGDERDRFEQSLMREVKDSKGNSSYKQALNDFKAKLAVNVICDENGVLLLKSSDYVNLSKAMLSAKLDLICEKAQKLNKITEEDKEAMIKNSVEGQNDSDIIESAEIEDSLTLTTGSEN